MNSEYSFPESENTAHGPSSTFDAAVPDDAAVPEDVAIPDDAANEEKSSLIFDRHETIYPKLIKFLEKTNSKSKGCDLSQALNLIKYEFGHKKYFKEDALVEGTPTAKDFEGIYDQRQEICHQKYSDDMYKTDNEILDKVEKYLDSKIGPLKTNTENDSKVKEIFRYQQKIYHLLKEYIQKKRGSTEGLDLPSILKMIRNKHTYDKYFSASDKIRRKTIPTPDDFHEILLQRNEVCHQNYSLRYYDCDKSVLEHVKNYLSNYLTPPQAASKAPGNSTFQSCYNMVHLHQIFTLCFMAKNNQIIVLPYLVSLHQYQCRQVIFQNKAINLYKR